MAALLTSCNSDDDSLEYNDPVNVAVTAFSLRYNSSNLGLDSAYFSIDLDHGVIFNADSLRKGTDISKVVANITFSTNVSSAVISMSGGSVRTGEIDYKENPSDSIDFTGNVTLTVKADNDRMSKTYRIKVNVHKENPDSLVWTDLAKAKLPSRLPDPVAQRTVKLGNRAVCLVQENDGTYTISASSDLYNNIWQSRRVSFPFTPKVETFTASDSELYMLSDDGTLYHSNDLATWTSTGQRWSSLIGAYVSTVVGLTTDGDKTVFAQYPAGDLNAAEAPADFPRSGTSNFVTLQNKWTSSPVAFFTGGTKTDGSLSDTTWAFDGAEWIRLSQGGIPALDGSSIIPYYAYRKNSAGDGFNEFTVWMLLGGRKTDGSFNRTVYISYDNGVNWSKGNELLQLPEMIPTMTRCDNVVMGTAKSSDLADAWKVVKRSPRRIKYEVDGETITWECPYIYLFGGYDTDNRLYNTIWQGVLTKLTFAPVI